MRNTQDHKYLEAQSLCTEPHGCVRLCRSNRHQNRHHFTSTLTNLLLDGRGPVGCHTHRDPATAPNKRVMCHQP
jgi:hypothetical protein